MDTKLMTRQLQIQKWAGIIHDRKASGLKVDEYCQLHDLSRHAYFYWLPIVKEAALQQAGFVEMPLNTTSAAPTLPRNNTAFDAQMTLRMADVEIIVNEDTPDSLLRRVIQVVRHAE